VTAPRLSARTAHLCIDMQRLFAEETDWHTPAMAGIVPNIGKLAEAFAGRTIFARFQVPRSAKDAAGSWRTYYEQWAGITAAVRDDPRLIEVMPHLAATAAGERTLDKPTYSLFQVPGLAAQLAEWGIDTVVVSGVETDVCVLATVFGAVDLGYHVVVAADAVTSSSPEGHDAVLRHVLTRMPQQIAILDTAEIVERHRDAP
jgi:nicotinamidase-related amidase